MNVYVMRHGTTVWNEQGRTQGRTGNRLSKNGKSMTEKVALDMKDVDIDVIFCSPLMRTVQTANIMNKYHHKKIIKDERLVEIEQGIFTGRLRNSLNACELELKNRRASEAGMESYENCFARIKNFVEFLKSQKEYKNILVVTHNCSASFIEDILDEEKIDFSSSKFLRSFKNAEVKKFVVDKGKA